VGVALQVLVSGLAAGVVYALVALGISLLTGLTGGVPLANGDLVAGAAGVGVVVLLGSAPVRIDPPPLVAAGLVLLTLATGAAGNAVVYLAVARPFLRRPGPHAALGWAAGGVAVGLGVRAFLARAFPRDATAVPDPLHLSALTGGDVLRLPGSATVPARLVPVVVLGLLLALAAERLLVRGRFGRSVRAVADDPDAAALVGVDADRVLLGAFVAAGLLAGAAALLATPDRALTADTGVVLGLKATAAALLGGVGRLRGAVVAGLALGVVESAVVATPAFGPAYADVFALGVLVVVLAVRPRGLRASPAPAAE